MTEPKQNQPAPEPEPEEDQAAPAPEDEPTDPLRGSTLVADPAEEPGLTLEEREERRAEAAAARQAESDQESDR